MKLPKQKIVAIFTDNELHSEMNYPRSLDHIRVGGQYIVESIGSDIIRLKGCDFTFHKSSFTLKTKK